MTTTGDLAARMAAGLVGVNPQTLAVGMQRVCDSFRGDIIRNGSEGYGWSTGGGDRLSFAGYKTVGHYLRSWEVDVKVNGLVAVGKVSTPTVYGPRLEFGFVGTEYVRAHTRNGHPVRAHTRVVNQQPRPHVEPAVEPNRVLMRRTFDKIAEVAGG